MASLGAAISGSRRSAPWSLTTDGTEKGLKGVAVALLSEYDIEVRARKPLIR
jgi:hypothetical protein